MSRELAFLVYCMERYRHFKGLSGADVARLFDEHGVYRYIIKYFESLHTMGDIVSYRILTIISVAVQINSSCRVFPPA